MDIRVATLQDLKTLRPDLCDQLYDEFMKAHSVQQPKKREKSPNKVADRNNGVKRGDVLHWNYTKEEGVVVGFDFSKGYQWIIVEQYDGSRIYFFFFSKLFKILEVAERDNVINKRKVFLDGKFDKECNKEIEKPKSKKETSKKTKQFVEDVVYDVPTRRGSKLKIGDKIRYKMTNEKYKVKGFIKKGGLDRIILEGYNKTPLTIIDNPSAYEIV